MKAASRGSWLMNFLQPSGTSPNSSAHSATRSSSESTRFRSLRVDSGGQGIPSVPLAREHRERAGEVGDAKALHRVEQEIENIKEAVKLGKATESLLEMLAEAEARRKALQNGAKPDDGVEGRLARALENLPALIEQHIADLRTVLAAEQIDTGKEILAQMVEAIILHATKRGPEVEMRGNLQGLLKLQAPGKRPGPECKTGGSGGRI